MEFHRLIHSGSGFDSDPDFGFDSVHLVGFDSTRLLDSDPDFGFDSVRLVGSDSVHHPDSGFDSDSGTARHLDSGFAYHPAIVAGADPARGCEAAPGVILDFLFQSGTDEAVVEALSEPGREFAAEPDRHPGAVATGSFPDRAVVLG